MDVSFVRVRGQRDRIYVHRTDGSEVSWVFPSYGDGLPHDLIHLVVEAAFEVRHGFWGRVDAGVDPARVNDEANRMGGAEKYRSFGDDRAELFLAEGLASAGWQNPDLSDEERRRAIAEAYANAGIEPPPTLTVARVAEVGAALGRLREAWRAIEAKGTIKLRFDARDLSRSFTEIAS